MMNATTMSLFIISLPRENVLLDCSLSHSPFAYFAYIFHFSPSLFTPKVILVLCDHRVRIFTAFRCGCMSITTYFGF